MKEKEVPVWVKCLFVEEVRFFSYAEGAWLAQKVTKCPGEYGHTVMKRKRRWFYGLFEI